MSTPPPALASVWRARPVAGPLFDASRLSPASVDASWQPLVQGWRPDGPEPGFHPGWARVGWHGSFLRYDAVFVGAGAGNRARRLNERTWELGDICEVFLQVSGQPLYLELHITPENQRLQLLWPPDGLERFRRGEAPLANFQIDLGDWVRSAVHVAPDYWVAQALIPANVLGLPLFSAQLALDTTVCRYDYSGRPEPVYSATAPLTEPSYHRRHEWQRLVLEGGA
ncbi:MAG: hypothetical protein JNG83_01055 [Opitutaceae bacterium]|nr:hypothetical protein [Opitutaceae bacterium]